MAWYEGWEKMREKPPEEKLAEVSVMPVVAPTEVRLRKSTVSNQRTTRKMVSSGVQGAARRERRDESRAALTLGAGDTAISRREENGGATRTELHVGIAEGAGRNRNEHTKKLILFY